MSGGVFAVTLAVAFTGGCIIIHEARGHAKAMTPPLAFIAACLGLVVGLTAIAEKPGAIDRETAMRATAGQLP